MGSLIQIQATDDNVIFIEYSSVLLSEIFRMKCRVYGSAWLLLYLLLNILYTCISLRYMAWCMSWMLVIIKGYLSQERFCMRHYMTQD